MKGIKEIIQIMGGIDSLDHRMVTIIYGWAMNFPNANVRILNIVTGAIF